MYSAPASIRSPIWPDRRRIRRAWLATRRRGARVAADEISGTTKSVATEAGTARGAMREIGAVAAAALPAVAELEAKSQQIRTIALAIGQLADRANLLSLNAAIEAARAGEHG